MAFARTRALRTLQSSLRHSGRRAAPRASAPTRTQLIQKRYQSGDSHGEHESSSDLPWAIGAVVVTIPSCWYLWPDSSHAESGHHGEHEEHEEHEEQSEEQGEKEEEQPKEEEVEGDSKEDKEADQQFEQEEAKKQDAEPTKDKEGDAQDSMPPGGEDEKQKEEQESSDRSSEDSEEGNTDSESETSKSSSSTAESKESKAERNTQQGRDVSEGENDSPVNQGKATGLGKPLGEGPQKAANSQGGDARESAATAKPLSDDAGDMSAKQKGFSNSPTKHSTKIDEDPEKSTKGEGTPETAKASGTVDPARPQK